MGAVLANGRPVRLGLFAASPIYYQAPLYRRIASDPSIDFTAIFASDAGVRPHDGGYGAPITWDVDALGGYRSTFLRRAAINSTGGSFFALRDWDVIGQILRGHYDVLWIHGYNSLTHTLAALTQLLRRRPLLIREEQTLLSPRPAWKRLLKNVWLRLLFSRAYALCIGTANRNWFRHYGMPDERMFLVPYAVDTERLVSRRNVQIEASKRKQYLRRRFDIPEEWGPVILSVGRMIDKKQPLLLLEAFRRVRTARPCCLLLIGSGHLDEAIRAKISAEGIRDVYMPGFLQQGEISDAYSCADVFVLASNADETWGVVVNEAMTFGLPIVVSDQVGSSEDLVRNGINGFTVPHNDVVELAARIKLLVDNSELRQRYGAASRDIVNNWNYQAAYCGIKAAVEQAVGAPGLRPA